MKFLCLEVFKIQLGKAPAGISSALHGWWDRATSPAAGFISFWIFTFSIWKMVWFQHRVLSTDLFLKPLTRPFIWVRGRGSKSFAETLPRAVQTVDTNQERPASSKSELLNCWRIEGSITNCSSDTFTKPVLNTFLSFERSWWNWSQICK